MKKEIISILFGASMLLCGQAAYGQELKEIIDKHFEVVGQDNLIKMNTITVNGKVLQMQMELPFVQKIKRPKKFRMEMVIQGQEMIQAFDGEDGWMIAPWVSPEPQDLIGIQLERAKEQSDFDGDLYNYEEKGHQLEFLGTEDMEGTEVFKLKLTKKSGNISFIYIDTDSYIVLKQTTKTNVQGAEVEADTYFSNYQIIEGIVMPMSIEVNAMGQSTQVVFDTVMFNIEMNDSIFVRPVKEKIEEEK